AILENLEDVVPGKLGIQLQLAITPARKPVCRSDPERPVAGSEQAPDVAGGERLAWWRLPGAIPDAVEAQQAGRRPQPEITVWRVGDGANEALREAVADLPCRVRVLADVERRIQGEDARARCEQRSRQEGAQPDGASSSRVGSPHGNVATSSGVSPSSGKQHKGEAAWWTPLFRVGRESLFWGLPNGAPAPRV